MSMLQQHFHYAFKPKQKKAGKRKEKEKRKKKRKKEGQRESGWCPGLVLVHDWYMVHSLSRSNYLRTGRSSGFSRKVSFEFGSRRVMDKLLHGLDAAFKKKSSTPECFLSFPWSTQGMRGRDWTEDEDDTAVEGNEVGLLVPEGVGSGAIHGYH